MSTISFVDVGQGDCTIVVEDSGVALIIDCPRSQYEAAEKELDAQGCQQVGTAIITHSDEDHAGGMLDLLEDLGERFEGDLLFNCDSVLATPVAGPDYRIAGRRRRALINRAREYRDRVKDARAGTDGHMEDVTWRLLAPTVAEIMDALAEGDPNLASGIVLLSIDGVDTLVGGDAPLKTWERIKDEVPTSVTVRWPHHGGGISESAHLEAQGRLFEILDPERVVISVGTANVYNHPFRAFFEARRSHGAKLICTEATEKCVTSGIGGPCAGTIRLEIRDGDCQVKVDAPDLLARIESFGNAQCKRRQVASG